MKECCLVTGGAGFIGCAVAPLLVNRYDHVIAVDNLHPQVHASCRRPQSLHARVELHIADVCDGQFWEAFLKEHHPTSIVHLAAETGTGQSLTEASRHAQVNVLGLTRLLDGISASRRFPQQVLLTSSRAVYGEGAWRNLVDGCVMYPGQRDRAMLERGQWDFPHAEPLSFMAGQTEPHPTSIYAATKLAQEHVLSAWTQAFSVGCSILRLQNVYGPGQALTNPYTGIVALFARLAKKGESIPLFEDGKMKRDFVFVGDVAAAIDAALGQPPQGCRTLDIGTGQAITIAELAVMIADIYQAPPPHVTGQFRNGDVRHASCRIDAACGQIGYSPAVSVRVGLEKLCHWIDGISP